MALPVCCSTVVMVALPLCSTNAEGSRRPAARACGGGTDAVRASGTAAIMVPGARGRARAQRPRRTRGRVGAGIERAASSVTPGVGFSGRAEASRAPGLATGFLMAVTVVGLSGCRTAPNVAAYVGDEQVTVAELDTAVDERLEDENIAAYAKGKEDEFTRRVLTLLVQEEVYAAAAERFDVQVDNDEVRARIDRAAGDRRPRRRSTASSPSRASAGRTSSRTSGSSWSARRSPPPRARPRAWTTRRCRPGTPRSAEACAISVRLHHRSGRRHRGRRCSPS